MRNFTKPISPRVGSALFFAIFQMVVMAGESPVGTSDARPNIIVVLCDDLGYGDLECYGHPHIKTPNLNSLAASGIRLTSCYSAAPVCSPSRVGLLTGRSPNRAGIYDWIPEVKGNRTTPDLRDMVHMRLNEVTLPRLLSQAGYSTCMSGKWHCNAKFNSTQQPQPSDTGFDHWFATQNNASPSHINPNNYVRNGQYVGEIEGSSCHIATDEVIDWLEKHKSENLANPFFVYLAFHEPHEPVASPPELVAQYRSEAANEDEAQFFANVSNVDLAVGRLVDALTKMNYRENTLIFFSADNGPETLSRYPNAKRSYGRPGPLRGMKLWTTEAGFRVAGIVNWPAKSITSHRSDQPVSSLDLLPTFSELAGVKPPTDLVLDGCSFAPLFHGGEIQRKKPLLWCYFNSLNEHTVAMRSGPWKMLAKHNHGELPKFSNVFEGNRNAIERAELTDFELYRVTDDLHEEQNVYATAEESAEIEKLMRAQYRELLNNSHVWKR